MILVVGGGGYIGKTLRAKLQQQSAGDLLSTVFLDKVNNFDFSNIDVAFSQIKQFRPTTVIFLAADKELRSRDDNSQYNNTYLSLRNTVDAIRALEVNTRIIFISSSAVYRDSADILLENSPIGPNNFYGMMKLRAEYCLEQNGKDIPYEIIRLFNCQGSGYGVTDRFDSFHVIQSIIRQSIIKQPFELYGCINTERDWISVKDTVDLIWRIAKLDKFDNRVWNFSQGKKRSIRDCIELVEKLSGHRIEIVEKPRNIKDRKIVYGKPQTINKVFPDFVFEPFEQIVAQQWHQNLVNERIIK